ncbi:hypothetical protein SNEBB_008663 [Seison nebaliae]|nr:hypothetical protein SNEBB_008663 [Seison nebaliae]
MFNVIVVIILNLFDGFVGSNGYLQLTSTYLTKYERSMELVDRSFHNGDNVVVFYHARLWSLSSENSFHEFEKVRKYFKRYSNFLKFFEIDCWSSQRCRKKYGISLSGYPFTKIYLGSYGRNFNYFGTFRSNELIGWIYNLIISPIKIIDNRSDLDRYRHSNPILSMMNSLNIWNDQSNGRNLFDTNSPTQFPKKSNYRIIIVKFKISELTLENSIYESFVYLVHQLNHHQYFLNSVDVIPQLYLLIQNETSMEKSSFRLFCLNSKLEMQIINFLQHKPLTKSTIVQLTRNYLIRHCFTPFHIIPKSVYSSKRIDEKYFPYDHLFIQKIHPKRSIVYSSTNRRRVEYVTKFLLRLKEDNCSDCLFKYFEFISTLVRFQKINGNKSIDISSFHQLNHESIRNSCAECSKENVNSKLFDIQFLLNSSTNATEFFIDQYSTRYETSSILISHHHQNECYDIGLNENLNEFLFLFISHLHGNRKKSIDKKCQTELLDNHNYHIDDNESVVVINNICELNNFLSHELYGKSINLINNFFVLFLPKSLGRTFPIQLQFHEICSYFNSITTNQFKCLIFPLTNEFVNDLPELFIPFASFELQYWNFDSIDRNLKMNFHQIFSVIHPKINTYIYDKKELLNDFFKRFLHIDTLNEKERHLSINCLQEKKSRCWYKLHRHVSHYLVEERVKYSNYLLVFSKINNYLLFKNQLSSFMTKLDYLTFSNYLLYDKQYELEKIQLFVFNLTDIISEYYRMNITFHQYLNE